MPSEELKYEVPAPVKNAHEKEQAGFPVLVGNCPRCGLRMVVNQPGKRPCQCGQMLLFGGG